MPAVAAATTIFHPPSDPDSFGQWMARYLASAHQSNGYVSERESVQANAQLDWAVEVSFRDADSLDAWLDGTQRAAVLRAGEAEGWWRRSADLVLGHDEPPPENSGVFLHSVASGKEAEFVAAQGDLTLTSSAFTGYEGTAVFPAESDGQWMSVLRFRAPAQLAAWMRSQANFSHPLSIISGSRNRCHFSSVTSSASLRCNGYSCRRCLGPFVAGLIPSTARRLGPVSRVRR